MRSPSQPNPLSRLRAAARMLQRPLQNATGRGTHAGVLALAVRKAQRSFIEFHAHAAFKIRAAALIGMIGFPAFYIVWRFLLPQPFESVTLRAIGFGLSTLVVLLPRCPLWLRRHGLAVSYVTIFYTVPFFFTFMLLMNDASTVWQLSLVSGFVYLVLLCDGINAVLLGIAGTLAGFAAFWLVTGGFSLPAAYVSVIPVLAFVLCGVAFLDYSNNLVVKEKMAAIGGLAAHIAHEMRTPLLGIRLDAEKIQTVMPDLMAAHKWAREHAWPGRIAPSMQAGLPLAIARINQHVVSANSVIDMLLMNAAADRARSEMVPCSARATVDTAIERYNFRAGQREMVDLELQADFAYQGVEVLTVHVLFNLMKNAFRAIEKTGAGRIVISLRRGAQRDEIVFRDSGPGMPPEIVRNIFLPFYSNEAIGIGNGIGLSFCRSVIESFDGTITCASTLGQGTEFVLSFPVLHVSPLSKPALSKGGSTI
jgi:two-component system, CAI-1 autoinducer sensor kinase/phosphatase CqsS